jgi:hypothetical protein
MASDGSKNIWRLWCGSGYSTCLACVGSGFNPPHPKKEKVGSVFSNCHFVFMLLVVGNIVRM